jgi:GTP-binding protein
MFRDEVSIRVKAGDGHPGFVAMLRLKYMPRGGPIGGDGGKGGDVIFQADENYNTLYHLIHQPYFRAEGGHSGDAKGCSGRNGRELVVSVPVGTIIRDARTGATLKDLEVHGQKVVICKGGKGGRGNRRFATPTRQTPRFAEPGEPGEERRLRLELKMIADVGLIGMPNAGKSTLLSRLSAARPRVAAYPFTTLIPSLGILKFDDVRTCVLADLPGLIEGAHEGKGLGDQFLRHIERTRILLHLVDAAPMAFKPPAEAYRIIRREISGFSPTLAGKPEVVVATKIDAVQGKPPLAALRKAVKKETGGEVLEISAATGTGLKALLRRLLEALDEPKVEAAGEKMV